MVKIFVANLHPPRKYILGWMAASLATFLLISLVVSVTVGTNMSQLNTLLHSKCEYSAIAQHSAAENTYYQYNAGISFTTAADSKTRFNAEVLMQTGEGHYSDAIYRNTTNLNRNGVAVSKNIADHYGLDVGNTIFSKHIVDGVIKDYIIENILPAVISTRISGNSKHSDGIIIMGYDERYTANISYSCIIFTNEPIEVVAEVCSKMPTDILYREDEIITVVIKIFPYLIVYVITAAVLIVITMMFLSKSIAGNFKRLASNGADFGALNHAYYKITIGTGIGVIIISVLISAVSFGMAEFYPINAVPALATVIAESITLIATATISNKRLWRN